MRLSAQPRNWDAMTSPIARTQRVVDCLVRRATTQDTPSASKQGIVKLSTKTADDAKASAPHARINIAARRALRPAAKSTSSPSISSDDTSDGTWMLLALKNHPI